ncbi:selenium binding protein [Sellimonas intestinalis]|uniref:selenium binding protein n=1 Tax=Sellimonas intestinalis TaxID=1653434 RepID=UPI0015EC17DC|nr:selenium binding protein [Sellimonas intestinalis]MBA2213622.1 selenium binding protein [Sellimonas intestinalis]
MYESYTRQSLPTKKYRELLGSAICVFCSNNAFLIENIVKTDSDKKWYKLIDEMSGRLKEIISETISANCENTEIENLFLDIVNMRNRIIHGFRITSCNGEQILATKTRGKENSTQFEITEEYLLDFIQKNQKLSDLLYAYREQYIG